MLPRRNSNRFCLDSGNYRYIVSEVQSAEVEDVALTVTVQSEDSNGAILRVTGLTTTRVPAMESKLYLQTTIRFGHPHFGNLSVLQTEI